MELVWQWNNVRPSIAGQVDLGAFREFTISNPIFAPTTILNPVPRYRVKPQIGAGEGRSFLPLIKMDHEKNWAHFGVA